jgi:hypothetical protein
MPKPIPLPPEIRADYDFLGNTFVSKDKEPEVEVGDIMVANAFEPQVKLKRWGNEANFSVRLVDTAPGQADVTVDKERVVWAKGGREARFYAQGWGVDNGAFEFEVIFNEKPSTNQVVFTIQSKELRFFYQPPLTAEEIAEGAGQPENVVSSYAVYHATKENMHPTQAEADKYKAGKAFHIFRPRVTDALGAEIWAELNIDEAAGELTITIDQDWLDSATYPVTVDPTFGYTTKGSTNASSIENAIIGSVFPISEDGTGVSITAGLCNTNSLKVKAAVYLHSDSSLVSNGAATERTIDVPNWPTVTWETFTFSTGPSLSNGVDYILVAWGESGGGNSYLAYDAGDTDQRHSQGRTYDGFPDPATFTHNNFKYSIYCTYTAAAAGQPTQIRTQGIPTGSGYRARPGAWN